MSNNALIEQFIMDPNYKIVPNGTIETRVNGQGHITNVWRIKPLIKDRYGYLTIRYKGKCLLVHRIVYAAHNGSLRAGLTINHIDGNPLNNSAANLEQVSQRENNLHKINVLKNLPNEYRRLTKNTAKEIRRLVQRENKSALEAAAAHNTSLRSVYRILKNKSFL